jgi:hypothetical protein
MNINLNNNGRFIMSNYDLIGAIIAYETGELSRVDTIEMFQILVNTGQAWTLQGHYGRTAQALIDQGLVIAKT